MKVEDLIRDIRDRGGDLALDGEAVVIHFKDPLPDELVGEARQHKTEIASYLRSHEAAHPDIASTCEGERVGSARRGRVSDCGVSPGDAEPGPVDRGPEAPQARPPATPTPGRAADVSVPPGHSRDTLAPRATSGQERSEDAPSTPVKHTRRRALASTPPSHPGPLTDGHYAFLYSVLKDGRVERGTLVSKDLKTEPEAYAFLRSRFPLLTVQWARVVTHRVCAGCKHFTAAVLCNADQSPDHAACVGSCRKYERAGEL
jgi:hypothetical protein